MRILSEKSRCRGVRGVVLAGLALMVAAPVHGQGSLPAPPEGFEWISQGVLVYSDSDTFSVDLGLTLPSVQFGQSDLSVPINLTAFNPMPAANEHIMIHSSTYEAVLSGLGSAVLLNLDGESRNFTGAVSLKGWEIVGVDGTTGSTDQTLLREGGDPQVVAMLSGALYSGTAKGSTMAQDLSVTGNAPVGPVPVSFQFNGTFDVDLNSDVVNAQIFGTSSAFGDVSLQTVHETFQLVAIPEPQSAWLALAGLACFLRRRRSTC